MKVSAGRKGDERNRHAKEPLAIAKSDTRAAFESREGRKEEFKVTLEIRDLPDEERNKLRPGMSATATVTTKTKQNVVAVPLQAIVEKAPPTPSPGPTIASSAPPAPGEKPKELKGVYTIDKANKVKFVKSSPASPASPISKLSADCQPVQK